MGQGGGGGGGGGGAAAGGGAEAAGGEAAAAGGAGEMAGMAAMASDKRNKTDIKDGSKKTEEFLNALSFAMGGGVDPGKVNIETGITSSPGSTFWEDKRKEDAKTPKKKELKTGDTVTDSTSSPQAPGLNPGEMYAARGGRVPAKVSPGEVYIPPHNVKAVAKGADAKQAGEVIPGKAKVKGDSLKNDTVDKDLESGGVVIPRSVMNSKDPAKEAAKFVNAILAKQNMRRK
jgi:hypothetical protein